MSNIGDILRRLGALERAVGNLQKKGAVPKGKEPMSKPKAVKPKATKKGK